MAVPEIVTVSVVSTPRVTAPEKVAAPPMKIISASDRRHVRCLITQSDGTLHVGNARNKQGISKTVEPVVVKKSVASLPRPNMPGFDVAPFSEIAPKKVMVSVPSDSSATSPRKESEPRGQRTSPR